MAQTGREQVASAIEQMIDRARSAVYHEMQAVTVDLTAIIKRDKLSGQVLNRVSGDLSRSVSPNAEVVGYKVIGTVGTNLFYGRIHEHGFRGDVAVSAHTRNTKYGVQNVMAHNRHVNLPERSFLRSSLSEMLPEIRERLAKSLVRGLNGQA